MHITLQVPADKIARLQASLLTKTARRLNDDAAGSEGFARLLRRGPTQLEAQLWLAPTGPARIELCLLSGPVQGLLELAAGWLRRHGLQLHAQQAGLNDWPDLNARQSRDAALRQMLGHSLLHLLPSMAALTADDGNARALHQFRVSLRRLRSALREFAAWSVAPDRQWDARLRLLSQGLGAQRDRDVLVATWLPRLQAAGAPTLSLPPLVPAAPMQALLQSPDSQVLWLELLAFAQGAAPATVRGEDLRASASAALRRQHQRLLKRGPAMLGAGDAERHRLRKRVKRMRYCSELCAALYQGTQLRRYQRALRRLQEHLGELNDLRMAEQVFRAQSAQDPAAWFAIGWLAACRAPCLKQTAAALQALADAPCFWKHPGKD